MTETQLDIAHARMEASPGDDALRLAFYNRLAEAELFLLLSKEATGDTVDPEVFDTGEGRFVLTFDRETRLTDFTGTTAPYAAISGRSLAALIAESDIGLGLNLGVAPSSFLMPASAVTWFNQTLSVNPEEAVAKPEEVFPPKGLPDIMITSLDQKLASARGLARSAYLVGATYADKRRAHLLAILDPVPGAETALARAAREALVFSGIEAGEMDVTFFRSSDAIAARLAKVGIRFDLPKADKAEGPQAPGMNPDRPPRLK